METGASILLPRMSFITTAGNHGLDGYAEEGVAAADIRPRCWGQRSPDTAALISPVKRALHLSRVIQLHTAIPLL